MPKEAIELSERVVAGHSGPPADGRSRYYYDDDAALRRLGKRPLLTRSFDLMSILGFSCSSLCSWESVLLSSVPGLLIGGPAGLTWGLVFNWLGITTIYASLAELASIAPTSGGQYHWVSMMAPKSWSYFLSYLTAWITTLAWQAIACTVGYLIATLFQGIIIIAQPTYIAEPWHTVLTIWAFGLFATVLNCINSRTLAKLETIILILHLAGFLAVLIPMVYFAPHNNASFVFTTFLNNGLWPTQGLAFMVGFPTIATSLMGADCVAHMSEEIQNAAIIVPQALMYTITINGALAFAMAIPLIFCIEDIEAAVGAVNTVFYPCLYVFQTATKSSVGACLMGGVILLLCVAGGIGIYASASRMLWSFSRDRGIPYSHLVVKLTKNSLPTNAICVTLLITALLSLISLGSAIALQALLSLSIAALYASYVIPCTLLLWRRLTGTLRPYPGETDRIDGEIYWGPWRVPEPFGTVNNVIACMYGSLTLFWSFWPMVNPPTLETANWSVVVFSGVLVFSIVWYILRARHYFKGPIKEV